MARKKQSKSDAIRAALAELGAEARNRDVIEKLAGEKVKVSAQMVSTVRARMNAPSTNGHRKPGRPGRKPALGTVSFAGLLAAKELVAATGSVAEAKSTLEVLGKLQ
ncbi:MAG: hypothetical protein U0836_11290 [Pirellulales bacterium]